MAFTFINKIEVRVVGFNAEKVVNSREFMNWILRIDPDYEVEWINVLEARFHNRRLQFAILDCGVRQKGKGRTCVFTLGGDSVAILPVIRHPSRRGSNDHLWTILTKQPRFAIGKSESIEIPTGMFDADDNFIGTAATEIGKAIGVAINRKDLHDLGYVQPYPSGSADCTQLYSVEIEMPWTNIHEIGNRRGSELIKLVPCPLAELQRLSNDPVTLVAWARFMGDLPIG